MMNLCFQKIKKRENGIFQHLIQKVQMYSKDYVMVLQKIQNNIFIFSVGLKVIVKKKISKIISLKVKKQIKKFDIKNLKPINFNSQKALTTSKPLEPKKEIGKEKND